MIKALKVISWISLISSVLLFVMILVAVGYDGPSSGVIDAMRDAICNRYKLPKGQPMSPEGAGYIFGETVFPQFLKYGLLLSALYSRKKGYYIAAVVVFILLILSSVGNQQFPFLGIIITVLLFTKPVRDYFKKATEPKEPEFDFEKNIIEK